MGMDDARNLVIQLAVELVVSRTYGTEDAIVQAEEAFDTALANWTNSLPHITTAYLLRADAQAGRWDRVLAVPTDTVNGIMQQMRDDGVLDLYEFYALVKIT